jgi:hypothetical protein
VAQIGIHPSGWIVDPVDVAASVENLTSASSAIRIRLGADSVLIHVDREDVTGVVAAIAADLLALLPVIGDPDVAA